MPGVFEQLSGFAGFDDGALTHHSGCFAHAPDDGEVMADEHKSQPAFASDFVDEVKNLGLDRDVEGAGRLVQHQDLG